MDLFGEKHKNRKSAGTVCVERSKRGVAYNTGFITQYKRMSLGWIKVYWMYSMYIPSVVVYVGSSTTSDVGVGLLDRIEGRRLSVFYSYGLQVTGQF